jgi:hypothetical protein
MTAHQLIDKFDSLCFGKERPTHIFVGEDLFEWLDGLVARERNHTGPSRGLIEVYRIRTSSGNLPFNGAEVCRDSLIPPMAAHFWNMNNPHDPRYNAYVDFGRTDDQRTA